LPKNSIFSIFFGKFLRGLFPQSFIYVWYGHTAASLPDEMNVQSLIKLSLFQKYWIQTFNISSATPLPNPLAEPVTMAKQPDKIISPEKALQSWRMMFGMVFQTRHLDFVGGGGTLTRVILSITLFSS
jgi:hypothetical protein